MSIENTVFALFLFSSIGIMLKVLLEEARNSYIQNFNLKYPSERLGNIGKPHETGYLYRAIGANKIMEFNGIYFYVIDEGLYIQPPIFNLNSG